MGGPRHGSVSKKGGLRHGSDPKRGVLGTGAKQKRVVLDFFLVNMINCWVLL